MLILLVIQFIRFDILPGQFFCTSDWNTERCPRKVWTDRGWEVLIVTEMWWWDRFISFFGDIDRFISYGYHSVCFCRGVFWFPSLLFQEHALHSFMLELYLMVILTGNNYLNFKWMGPDIFNLGFLIFYPKVKSLSWI